MAGMFELLLQAAPASDVHSAPGMTPEWIRTLITAATGAVIGIGSNILMEFVRPYIVKTVARRTMAAQLSAELIRNLRLVEAGYQWLQNVEGKERIVVAKVNHTVRLIPPLIKSDRFLFFASTQKAVMYEYDPEGSLERFYQLTNRLMKLSTESAAIDRMQEALGLAALEGANFAASHKLTRSSLPVTQKEITLMHSDFLETQGDVELSK